jgi:hypothetical protein
MYDLAFSPPASATDAGIQRKLFCFQGDVRKTSKRASEYEAATERYAKKVLM